MCILQVGENQEQERSEVFCGCIKSFNARRGFGFVSCEETAKRFGRDVYLAKDEAMTLAAEPSVGQAAVEKSEVDVPEKSKVVPVQEGDVLLFQVKLSTEGFPQAVQVRKIRRLRGVVRTAPSATLDGILVVDGEASDQKEVVAQSSDTSLAHLLGAEVRLRQSECGQLQLAPGDEVAFCCANMADTNGQVLEAQLVELLLTSRVVGSVLGYFSLRLPLFTNKPATEYQCADEDDVRFVELQGHALTDCVLLSDVPLDVSAADLMRLFGKLGGKDATMTPVTGHVCFASISFAGHEQVAKFLVQATHTISESGATQLAHVGACLHNKCSGTPPAPLQIEPARDSRQASQPSLQTCHETMQASMSAPCQLPQSAPVVEFQRPAFGEIMPGAFSQQLQIPQMPSPGAFLCSTVPAPAPVPAPTMTDWRCMHGGIVVPPAVPEMQACLDTCCGLIVRWPTVIHASAYIVELMNQSTGAAQRFSRMLPEGGLPALVDLRVDGLQPGQYAACVRCVAPCGCESACSPWSFLPLSPMMPSGAVASPPVSSGVVSLAPAVMSQTSVPAAAPSFPCPQPPTCAPVGAPSIVPAACPPPPNTPPCLPLSAMMPKATLPQIPEELAVDAGNACDEILTLD